MSNKKCPIIITAMMSIAWRGSRDRMERPSGGGVEACLEVSWDWAGAYLITISAWVEPGTSYLLIFVTRCLIRSFS